MRYLAICLIAVAGMVVGCVPSANIKVSDSPEVRYQQLVGEVIKMSNDIKLLYSRGPLDFFSEWRPFAPRAPLGQIDFSWSSWADDMLSLIRNRSALPETQLLQNCKNWAEWIDKQWLTDELPSRNKKIYEQIGTSAKNIIKLIETSNKIRDENNLAWWTL